MIKLNGKILSGIGSINTKSGNVGYLTSTSGNTLTDLSQYAQQVDFDTTTKTLTVQKKKRFIYVDESAATNGVGSIQYPFNTLAAAVEVYNENDIIHLLSPTVLIDDIQENTIFELQYDSYLIATKAIPKNIRISFSSWGQSPTIIRGQNYTIGERDSSKISLLYNGTPVRYEELNAICANNSVFELAITAVVNSTEEDDGYLYFDDFSEAISAMHTAPVDVSDTYSITGRKTIEPVVYIADTVNLDTAATITTTTGITIKALSSCSNPMFKVNAAITLSGGTYSGKGVETMFEVESGTLTLNGGVTLTNCDTAAYLASGNLMITQAVIHANRYSVYLTTSNRNLVLNPESGTVIDGAVYVPNGKRILVRAALTAVTGEIQVTSEQTASNTIVATCTDSSMATASASKLIINGTAGRADSNTIVINSTTTYIDPLAADGGDGSKNSPYNDFDTAYNAATGNDTLVILNTVIFTESKSYDNTNISAIRFDCSEGMQIDNYDVTFTDIDFAFGKFYSPWYMFDINRGSTLTLNNCTLTAKKKMTGNALINVGTNSGLTLNGTSISIRDKTQYSIKLADSTSTFNLTPSTGTSISGIVYLPTNNYIRVGSTLTALSGTVTIGCETPSNGLQVAYAASTNFDEFSDADAAKLVYQNDDYIVVVSEDDTIQLILSK